MFDYLRTLIICLLIGAITTQNGQFLAQKPASMVPCSVQDPNNCLATNIQTIFREFKNDLPGLSTVSGIEPVLVEKIAVKQIATDGISLNLALSNMNIAGASAAQVSNVRLNLQQNTLSFDLNLPLLKLNSNYNGTGTLLGFALQSSGLLTMSADNINYKIDLLCKPRYENNYSFFDIQQFRGTLVTLNNVKIQVDNLFNGQAELENAVNRAINKNWRSLYDALYPSINDAFMQAFQNHFRAYFSYIPAQYFINDLPTKP